MLNTLLTWRTLEEEYLLLLSEVWKLNLKPNLISQTRKLISKNKYINKLK